MYSTTIDVLIKILEGLLISKPKKSFKGKIPFGDDLQITIQDRGHILLNTGTWSQIALTNVLHKTKLKENILNSRRLD